VPSAAQPELALELIGIALENYMLKSILMALCTQTPASNLASVPPYRIIHGVHQVDKDQRHLGALCLVKNMVSGMCGDTSGDPRPLTCAPVWKHVFLSQPSP